jgi:hypothetical protein
MALASEPGAAAFAMACLIALPVGLVFVLGFIAVRRFRNSRSRRIRGQRAELVRCDWERIVDGDIAAANGFRQESTARLLRRWR